MTNPESKSKGRLFGLLRILLALGILGWIATTLPWEDQLSVAGDQGTVTATGTIEGEWKEDRIAFRFLDGTELGPEWPGEARAAVAAGQAFDVVRRGKDEDGYDWQPSITRAFREMDSKGLALAMALFVGATFLSSTRWWRLLHLAGCSTPWFNAFRLTYIGFCFNLVMPGLTGGDLVKGVIAAKENPNRRADAVVSVVIDRLIGLAALAILGAVVILLSGDTFAALRLPLVGAIVAGLVGAALYANKGLRKRLGLSALVDRLPLGDKLRSLDEAALTYLRHPGEVAFAFLLSFLNHLVVCTGVFFLARAIGIGPDQAGLKDFLVLAPVANIVSAIPLAPGGWGLGEFVYRELFEMIHLSGALGVAVSVTFRLCMLFGLGLIGSIFLLMPGVRAEVKETSAT
ncbi:MAG TPA: flippase-like domain-containing protein [Planctomycetes bacterium]|nr:flippase-like domain-containing protein [Planctomycetota bacterium]